MEGFLTLRQRHALQGDNVTKKSPFIGRPFQDPPPSTPVAVFVPSTELDTNLDTNAEMNIRVISTLSQKMGNEFRVTIIPADGGDPLTCDNVGVGRYAGDPLFPNMTEAPIEASFGGVSGFASQTTPQVSDWMPAGIMTGMEAGEKVVVSFNTGVDGEAGLRIAAATNATTFFQTLPDNWSDPDTLADGYVLVSPAKNYGVGLIETRTVGAGNYILNPLGYQKSPPIIPPAVLSTYFKATLIAAGITRSAPIFLMTDSLVPVSVKKNLVAASFTKTPPILPAQGLTPIRILAASSITKAPPIIGAGTFAQRVRTLAAANFTKTPPLFSAAIVSQRIALVAANVVKASPIFPSIALDNAAFYANGEVAPAGYHWEFVTDDFGNRIIDDATGDPIVDLVAD